MQLREYQSLCVNSIFSYFEENTGNPIVAMPTGTGKSPTMAGFIATALHRYPSTRIIKLTHVKELIEQNYSTLKRYWPQAPAGVYSAGLRKKQFGYPITFGGIDSVVKVDPTVFGKIDMLLIDECHLLSQKKDSRYQVFINGLKQLNPHLKTIGFTATPYRLGQGLLTEDGLFTDICFDATGMEAFNWFLDEGYLSYLIPRPTETTFDIDNVRLGADGDYNKNQLQEAVDKHEVTYAAIEETVHLAMDRNHWLIFSTGIEHSIHIQEILEQFGIASVIVHSKMPSKERDQNILSFKQRKVQAIINTGILTTGFDDPAIDLIAVLRPTTSTSLWVQLLGRGTRPFYAPGFDLHTKEGRLAAIEASVKRNCLVLDFARNTLKCGPINDPVLPKKKGSKKGSGIAPIKLCPACLTYNHASARFCISCGEEFPKSIKISDKASTNEIIKKGAEAEAEARVTADFEVTKVTYQRYTKTDKLDSLLVSYFCGYHLYKEWICLEHPAGSIPRKKANQWWFIRSNGGESPTSVAEALRQVDILLTPKKIRVTMNTKYKNIVAYDFNGHTFDLVEEQAKSEDTICVG